jgi:hypothetical protein
MIKKLDDYMIAAVTVACVVGFSILACSKATPKVTAEPQFTPIVDEWRRTMKSHGIDSIHDVFIGPTVRNTSGQKGVVAWCDMSIHKISVFFPTYDRLQPLQKKMTLWHELGHCAFDLGHVAQDQALTIMNPRIYSEESYVMLHKVLEDEYIAAVKIRLAFPH